MDAIRIKEAAGKDAALIADLSRETFYQTFVAQNKQEDMDKFMNEQFTREALIEEVGAPGNTFLLAYLEDEVAGYVRLREGDVPEGVDKDRALEIARLYAATSFIGKGVGKALMAASLDRAWQMGKDMIWLGVWEKNERAIAFYRQWGFEKFGEHHFLLGNDVQRDWLMKKNLRLTAEMPVAEKL